MTKKNFVTLILSTVGGILFAAKAINLTAALVSMLALETAMISQFGLDNEPRFRQIMTASSGGVVCVFVLGMAIYMIAYATKQIKKQQFDNTQAEL